MATKPSADELATRITQFIQEHFTIATALDSTKPKATSDPPRIESKQDVAALIDHTLLKEDATEEGIDRLCEEARRYGFAVSYLPQLYIYT